MASKSDFIYRYRVRNWPDYNRALVRRGSLTLWVDEQVVRSWRATTGSGPLGGRPRTDADTAIECALVVKAVFHLSLRATQGFLESVVDLMGVELPVPDYTTVSRRQAGLELDLGAAPASTPRHVVIDTTGLKVFGTGEWYARKHGMGRGRRRTWRKLHLGVDETTKEIVAVDLTTSAVHDSPHLPTILDQIADVVDQVSGDRAYDSGTCYEAILAHGATPTIPPRRNARSSRANDPPAHRVVRDDVLKRIKAEGRYPWRTSRGATRQSIAENAVSRFKALVGVKLAARTVENQRVEAVVKSRVLNLMTSLGMPRSERIAAA
jgi:hypothetical protein